MLTLEVSRLGSEASTRNKRTETIRCTDDWDVTDPSITAIPTAIPYQHWLPQSRAFAHALRQGPRDALFPMSMRVAAIAFSGYSDPATFIPNPS
jgi:hypothetical protein